MRRSRLPPLASASATGAVVVLVVAYFLPQLPSSELSLRLDAYASAGSSISLFLNDQSEPPEVEPLQAGRRAVYEFAGPQGGDIERIRLDVGERDDAHIRFFSLDVLEDDGDLAAHFGPTELSGWAQFGVLGQIPDAEALHIVSEGPRATIDAFVPIDAESRLPWPLQPLVDEFENEQSRLRAGFLLLGLAAAALAYDARRGRWAAGLGAAAAVVLVVLLNVLLERSRGLEPASDALGRATYLGLSLPANIVAIRALFACGLLLAIAAAAVWLWRGLGDRWDGFDAVDRRASEGRGLTLPGGLVAGGVALAALGTLTPDLRGIVDGTISTQHPSGWDVENLTAWTSFSAQGLVPMRDFWYPYGNWDIFTASLLTGPVLYAAFQFLLLGAFWWIFWVVSGRRLVASSLATLGLLFAQPTVGEFPRYGLAVGVALAYTCIDPDGDSRRALVARGVFAGLAALALFLDPVLFLYAGAGIALLLVVDAIRGRKRGFGWWGRRLTADFAVPAAAVLLWIVFSALRGQLGGMVELYTSLSASAAYSALPTDLTRGIRSSLALDVLIVWVPAFLVAIGVFVRLARGQFMRHGLASRLIVLGAVGEVLLHKHAVRLFPIQMLLVPVVAAILLLLWANARDPSSNLVGALTGLAFAVAVALPGPALARDGIEALPERVFDAFDLVLTDRDDVRRANAARFAPSRFAGYPQELALAGALAPQLARRSDRNLFVLGDAPVLYVLLDQRPPWNITVYDTSPLESQRRAIDWLEEYRPRFVVVDRLETTFDGVPHQVRIPLVYRYVVENYVLDRSVGTFDVLRLRLPAEPVGHKYWASALTTELDLGHVPNVSSYGELEPCGAGTANDCGKFLRLHAPSKDASGLVQTRVRFGIETVNVKFTADGDRNVYTLPLARTWPWALSQQPELVGQPTAGWRAELVAGVQPGDDLY